MAWKVLVLFAALLVSSAAAQAKETRTLQQLVAQGERAPQTAPARADRRTHPSEDEREIITKQIIQAISDMMNSDCVSSRDYQGWVDFGRRDAE